MGGGSSSWRSGRRSRQTARWLVYGITRANRDNEVRVQPSDGGAVVKAVAFGEQPAFSDDSRWLAYLIGFSEEQEAKLRKDKKPLHKKLGLLELASGRETVVDGIESFSFSPSGTHLAMRRYAPEPASNNNAGTNAAPASDETVAPGTTLVVRELATGRDTTFGSVSEMAWQDKGSLLALAVTVEGGVGNGIQLFDSVERHAARPRFVGVHLHRASRGGRTRRRWRRSARQSNDAREGPTHVVLAWPDVTRTPTAARELDAGEERPCRRSARRPIPRAALVRRRCPHLRRGRAVAAEAGAHRGSRAVATADRNEQQSGRAARRAGVASERHDGDGKAEARRTPRSTGVDAGRVVGRRRPPRSHRQRAGRGSDADSSSGARPGRRHRCFGDGAQHRPRRRQRLDRRSEERREIGARCRRIEDRYLQASPGGRYLLYLKSRSLLDDGSLDGPADEHHSRHRDDVRRQGVRCRRSRRSRRLASPDGRPTTAACCSTTSWTSGRSSRTAAARRG